MSKVLKVPRYIALNACVKYCTKDQSDVEDACCMLFAKYFNKTRLSNTSKILKQAITDYIEFILFHVKDVYNVYELQCRF